VLVPTHHLTVGRRRLAAIALLAIVVALVAWRHVSSGAPAAGAALPVAPSGRARRLRPRERPGDRGS
jgi:hypothetical protein